MLTLFDDIPVSQPPINERLIISLYDYTGNWAEPYVKAGYPVMMLDKKIEGDILDFELLEEWFDHNEPYVYGVLAAPPCEDFAGSGARWWSEKDKEKARLEESIHRVEVVLMLVNLFKVYKRECEGNFHFWVMENPVGRIERLVPEIKPYRKHSFDPADYGDPYTKKTILWGEFNDKLPKAPVLPVYGSAIHKMSSTHKAQRSATPKGFAQAFFKANK